MVLTIGSNKHSLTRLDMISSIKITDPLIMDLEKSQKTLYARLNK